MKAANAVVFLTLCNLLADASPRSSKLLGKQRVFTRYHSFTTCTKRKSATSSINSTFHRDLDSIERLDSDLTFSRTANTLKEFSIAITKCADAVSFNTCEYYQTWKWSLGICPLLVAPGMPWSSFYQNVDPPPRCPIRTGVVYRVRNGSLDLYRLMQITGVHQPEGNVFIAEVVATDQTDTPHFCSRLQFEVLKASIAKP